MQNEEIIRSEDLNMERYHEIREIRALLETHMNELKENLRETDALKEKDTNIRAQLDVIDKEFELLEKSTAGLKKSMDEHVPNMRNVKLFIRKRSEEFRNQIKLYMSILERTLDYADNPEDLRKLIVKLEKQLEEENATIEEIDSMYESEVKNGLKNCEKIWQKHHVESYGEIKDILSSEGQSMSQSLNEIMKKQNELNEILRSTHLTVIDNSTEKLKQLIQEEENSPHSQLSSAEIQELKKTIHHIYGEEYKDSPLNLLRYRRSTADEAHREELSMHKNCNESDNNLSPRCYDTHDHNDINQANNSFNNLNVDDWQNNPHPTARERDSMRQNAQRHQQVVTEETEANRPRFGRKNTVWD